MLLFFDNLKRKVQIGLGISAFGVNLEPMIVYPASFPGEPVVEYVLVFDKDEMAHR